MIIPVEIDSCVSTRRTTGRQPSTRPNHSTTQRSLFAFFDTATLGEASGKQQAVARYGGRPPSLFPEQIGIRQSAHAKRKRRRTQNYCQRSSGRRKISFKITARRIPSPPGASPQSQVPDSPPPRPPAAEPAKVRRGDRQTCRFHGRISAAAPANCLSTEATRSPVATLVADLLHCGCDVLRHVLGDRLRAASGTCAGRVGF